MRPQHPRTLLVEGATDKRVIPYLMEANGVTWPEPPHHPVEIESWGSVDDLLKPEAINNAVKEPGREALGVVVDANGDAAARWDQLRARCSSEFAELPERIPAEGLQVVHALGPRFGVWIMPDNRFTGMLEDLLVRLIPEDSGPRHQLARDCVAESRLSGARFRNAHQTKVEIHTWLAWQDPPGLQLHEAVNHTVLDPTRPESRPFVNWFKSLFRLGNSKPEEDAGRHIERTASTKHSMTP